MLDDYRKLSANSNMADYFSNTICDLQTVSLADDLYSHAKNKSCHIPYIYEHSVIQERDD